MPEDAPPGTTPYRLLRGHHTARERTLGEGRKRPALKIYKAGDIVHLSPGVYAAFSDVFEPLGGPKKKAAAQNKGGQEPDKKRGGKKKK